MKPRVLYLTSEYSLRNGWGTCAVNWIEGLAGRSPGRLRSFVRDIHPSIKVVSGTRGVVRDFGGVLSIPAVFIFDKTGKEVFRLGGDRGGHGRHYLKQRQLEQVMKKIS